ncbi:MAG: iron ABC transporter permease [Deltaproteobacteria bacterium RBG_16_54_11]|nr:MAG: iron ABC transporter permease [Deltaproteobacteria bacterium RBG_16_54_11]
MKLNSKSLWLGWILVLAVLLVIVCLFSLGVGAVNIPLQKVLVSLTKGRGTPEYTILFAIRLPRILLGLAVGGGLAIAGVVLQGMFRNPLVEPYTLGISGGAALGVAVNIVAGGPAGIGLFSLPISGFLGAVGIISLVYILGTRGGAVKLARLLLIGVMVSFIASALIMLIMAMTRTEDLHGIIFWIMGSLEEPDTSLIRAMLFISLGGLIVSLFFSVDLNAFSLGEEEAFHLGVPVERVKKILFLLASFLTGCCVSVTGIIGFVGLVIPHLMRLLVGGDHRILLVTSFLAGAIFLILCDTLTRVVMAPVELPVGVITGLVGGSIFIYALSRKGASF